MSALASHPSIDMAGMKCAACGHALSHHNTLGYCQTGSDAKGNACLGSCNWHPRDGRQCLASMREWDDEHGAGKVRRRMEANGQSTDAVFW